ncbi:hypothetical protein BDN70DRAFT_63133 [Pholiota conissans]|uniref:Glycoside hydrolase 131 catalytic N-terminal domain-containing protein n=1 Tax=Pholiota conissans TaxID=109636 RepID=A0A9P5Z1U4_9AGAR|nr:hypothetical protein BDN70DRAFT_63133 [Pholiota conissans]
MVYLSILSALLYVISALATPVIFDGRAPFSYTESGLNNSIDPYLTVVKGSENASHYTALLGHSVLPTPLWNRRISPLLPGLTIPNEQVVAVSIDNSSVFLPGGTNPQFGFRRTDIIAQKGGSAANPHLVIPLIETGVTVFRFSIKSDPARPLNYTHEYQIVFIEPNDGSHVFGIQLGSPFTNPTGVLPALKAHSFKGLDHALDVLFLTPFTTGDWHNFAVQVDWTNRTLAILYSKNGNALKAVTKAVPNLTTAAGSTGQGDFHFGVLKLPLVNPADTPANQGDVVHHGIQEGTTERLLYSGVFVEGVKNDISVGGEHTIHEISS